MEFDEFSNRVIACAIEVYRELEPGLFESTYEQYLAHELKLNGIAFRLQHPLPVEYKGIREAQLLTYMKLAGIKTGLLINFNVAKLKTGIKLFCSLTPSYYYLAISLFLSRKFMRLAR